MKPELDMPKSTEWQQQQQQQQQKFDCRFKSVSHYTTSKHGIKAYLILRSQLNPSEQKLNKIDLILLPYNQCCIPQSP